jgi:hypothetical protein
MPTKQPECGRFLARVLIHVPEPHKHWVHFYGAYADRVPSSYRSSEGQAPPQPATDATPSRRALTKRWRELIYRVYEATGGAVMTSASPPPSSTPPTSTPLLPFSLLLLLKHHQLPRASSSRGSLPLLPTGSPSKSSTRAATNRRSPTCPERPYCEAGKVPPSAKSRLSSVASDLESRTPRPRRGP